MASDRGVTEKAVGTRIFSNMETRYIETVNDVEAHMSEDALACDLVILTNRIKEHTDIDWPEPLPEGCKAVGQKFLPLAYRSEHHQPTGAAGGDL
jgi:hypothetical protein